MTNDSLDKFPLYAALRVPEVWRYKDTLQIWLLKEGEYIRHQSSLAIPILNAKVVNELLHAKANLKRPAWLRHARKRIRALLA